MWRPPQSCKEDLEQALSLAGFHEKRNFTCTTGTQKKPRNPASDWMAHSGIQHRQTYAKKLYLWAKKNQSVIVEICTQPIKISGTLDFSPLRRSWSKKVWRQGKKKSSKTSSNSLFNGGSARDLAIFLCIKKREYLVMKFCFAERLQRKRLIYDHIFFSFIQFWCVYWDTIDSIKFCAITAGS